MDTPVRAKFYCYSVTKTISSPDPFLYSYKFNVVINGSDENRSFWRFTPSGTIELGSIREDLFEVGKEYYIDFTLFVPAPTKIVEKEQM